MKATLDFKPDTHEYSINGLRVPSVTQIVRDLIPGYDADEWYMQRGQANHACYALLAQGRPFKADPQSEGNIRAWKAWASEFKPQFAHVERQVFSPRYRFGGTLDAVITCGIMQSKSVLIDYKESLSSAVKYQLGGYHIALKEEGISIPYGMGVELTHEGNWKCTPLFDLKQAGADFLHLLSAFNIRRYNGIKEK